MLALVISSLEDDKAINISSINLAGKTSIADFMVVASGTSQRHVGSIADHVGRRLKEQGHGQVAVEGARQCDWILIDAGDVIVHVFRPEVREFYRLEKMWAADLATGEGRATG